MFKKPAPSHKETEEDLKETAWQEAYEDELEGFAEFELDVFIEEMCDTDEYPIHWTPELVLRCCAFIAQHGTNQGWIDVISIGRFEFENEHEARIFQVEYMRGKTPIEVAWRLYKVSDEENKRRRVTVKTIREAMTRLSAKDGDGKLFTPFEDFDPERNWDYWRPPKNADPLLTEGAKIKPTEETYDDE